jgi:hypothetical protein
MGPLHGYCGGEWVPSSQAIMQFHDVLVIVISIMEYAGSFPSPFYRNKSSLLRKRLNVAEIVGSAIW